MKKILVAAVTLLFLFACFGLFADEPVFTGPLVKLINSGEITAVSVFYGNYSPFFTRGKQVENIKTIKMLDDKVIIITNDPDLSFTLPLSSVRAYGYDAKANRLILYMQRGLEIKQPRRQQRSPSGRTVDLLLKMAKAK